MLSLMNKKILIALFCCYTVIAHAQAVLEIVPTSNSPVALFNQGSISLNYFVKNNSGRTVNALSIDPKNGNSGQHLLISMNNNTCVNGILNPGAQCSFTLNLQSKGQAAQVALAPKVCAFKGAVCSIPVAAERVLVTVAALPIAQFPTPYAGTFYPIYNYGAGQWLPPTLPPIAPFQDISAIFVAFAHAYPQANGAIFAFERGQQDQSERLASLANTARRANPKIKILMSLGWGKQDWTYINTDYVNRAHLFVPSIIRFIRDNRLDGVDIDDESIGSSSGVIPQTNFNGVIANLRNALNYASLQDGKPYYLTITPAGNNQPAEGIVGTQIDAQNVRSFDLINIQSYFNPDFADEFYQELIALGYPQKQIAHGIDTGEVCDPDYPPYIGFAGIFNWNLTKDSTCDNYINTRTIAEWVGYY